MGRLQAFPHRHILETGNFGKETVPEQLRFVYICGLTWSHVRNLIPHFIQDHYLKGNEKGAFEAYTMFIDLSGFTPLTETLMREGNEGAERLSRILNRIFVPTVRIVYEQGGFIPHFAGDAFTAIFPEINDPRQAERVLSAAQHIRDLFGSKDFRFGKFQIGIKVGLSFGMIEWGIVGQQHKTYYFRGKGIEQCTESQVRASQQEIILDQHLRERLPKAAPISSYTSKGYFLYTGYKALQNGNPVEVNMPPIQSMVAKDFLPDSVIAFNEQGEFRSVISVFCSFSGIKEHKELNDFVSIVLNQVYAFSGYFKEVDFGDKGGVLVAFFGAPVSFENNVERALEFVAAIREQFKELEAQIPELSFRVGITSGVAYTGMVGGQERCQYAAVGNQVNLAARLMTYADWGEVLVDEEIARDRHFIFELKGHIRYKGVEGPVTTYKIQGRNQEALPGFSGNMVGREREMRQLNDHILKQFKTKESGVVFVYGEAGIGKSRLAFELHKVLSKKLAINWFTCLSDQILRKPFNAFIYFLKNYFNQSPESTAKANIQRFDIEFGRLIDNLDKTGHPERPNLRKELIRTRDILAALIGLDHEDSIWRNLDAKGRFQNTLSALQALFLAEALIRPTIIELEDAHWMDEYSITLLDDFIRKIKDYQIVLLITSRYNDDNSKPQVIDLEKAKQSGLSHLEIDLNILTPDALRTYAEAQLKAPISDAFFTLLQRTTNGNPFYMEQLLEYFRESQLLEKNNGRWHIQDQSIKLSNSIQAILTARIDRLSALVKETVKAAAVIGREFELPVLSEVMKSQELFAAEPDNLNTLLHEQIAVAERSQIWQAMNELRYIFKHSLLREAVYDMQLRTRLRQLHLNIAEAIEKVYNDQIEQHYVDLAFHYEQAENWEKTKRYLQKAGDFARRNFQNQRSLDFYGKLLNLLEDGHNQTSRFKVLLKKGQILELIGQWEACRKVYNQALTIAQELDDKVLLGRSNNCLGHLLLLQGHYKEARLYLEIAANFFETIEDQIGISKVYGDLGNLYFRQGKYNEAKSHFIRSIEINQGLDRSTPNSPIVANLGLTYMNQGEYDEGIRWLQQQLELCRKENDRKGMAGLYTNMGILYFEKGDYDSAGDSLEKGMHLAEELGDKQLTSIAIGCLGSVFERKGYYQKAMENFQKDLQIAEELGDQQGTAIALGLIGDLCSVMGQFEAAVDYLDRTLTISRDLGYKKGTAKALNTLGDIYYFKKQYPKSLKYYDQAIKVTREINNRLVLGSSLYEKGLVLVEMKQYAKAKAVHREANEIAELLGNPELLFNVHLLHAIILWKEGKQDKAHEFLKPLFDGHVDAEKRAALLFLRYSIQKDPHTKKEALHLYRSLYRTTPKFIYHQRMQELEAAAD